VARFDGVYLVWQIVEGNCLPTERTSRLGRVILRNVNVPTVVKKARRTGTGEKAVLPD
jgi:hypothetical protein